MEGEKFIMGLKIFVNQHTFDSAIRKIFSLRVFSLSLYGCEVQICRISLESYRKIKHIENFFITYNLKIKGNTSYPILLIKTSLYPIESTTMIRYLI
jgi:hypothetical protein